MSSLGADSAPQDPWAGAVTGLDRAWGWVRQLLDGGSTEWAQWTRPGAPLGRVVPGAQQLELLRRLNETSAGHTPGDTPGHTVPATLARRVLEASAPGRGRPDLELVGAARDSRFGARPVDPSALDDEELLRVAGYLLAQDLVALGPVPRRPDALPRPWRRRYRLVGDPLLSDPLRRELVARGRGPRPGGLIVIVGTDLDRMLADAWTARCFDHAIGSWPEWVETWHQRGQVPPRVDLPRIARTWTERRGPGPVHVVTDPALLPPLLGVRRLQVPPRPGLAAAELARRLAAVLGLMVTPARRTELLVDGLLPRLPQWTLDAGLPAVPDEHRDWVERRARRMARQLARAGHPGLAGGPVTGPGVGDGVLSLAMQMLLGGWKEQR
ncbi:hypothetical protein [Nocardioides sp. 616]|uniref:hypothetical protein n=1 Tax=Nocardioides sp. 616 TaxID=2268090 RepID=UPI000CE50E81|nr:hypothetical protein [Nocardioides sp. 616]